MSTAANNEAAQDLALASAIFDRVATDLSLICDREFVVESVTCERTDAKSPAAKKIHISFKLELRAPNAVLNGSLILPLPESIALASYLMMMPDDAVKSNRNLTTLDRTMKDAMVEIGNLIGGATDAVMREQSGGTVAARSGGCQGIRPGQNPAFSYTAGTPLVCAKAKARLHTLSTFEMVLQLPPVPMPEAT
ncbi:MAG: hypothetical protein HZA52_09825 [Planctomycetes bacterium]|nr:hypothetical protein [Planctomycetota bacterium]